MTSTAARTRRAHIVVHDNRLIAFIPISAGADSISEQVADLMDAVNGRARTRTVSGEQVIAAITRRLSGERDDLADINGGGVANSYGYATGSTSALVAVQRVRGGWLVGVVASRMTCSNRHVSMPISSRDAREYKSNDHAHYLRLIAAGIPELAAFVDGILPSTKE